MKIMWVWIIVDPRDEFESFRETPTYVSVSQCSASREEAGRTPCTCHVGSWLQMSELTERRNVAWLNIGQVNIYRVVIYSCDDSFLGKRD